MASRYHYPSLTSFPDVEIAAICDLIPEKARQAAERFGIPRTYVDYRQMLDEVDPEAVWVLMPPQHLFGPASTVLQQGRHLFVEKPLALTTGQARMLAFLAERRGCLTMVGFQRRHIPAATDLRQRVEARGPIHHAAVSFLKATRDLTVPAGFYDGAIDPLTSDGIHAVDTLRWLCGGEPVEVFATARQRYVPGPYPNEYLALLTFSTGAVGVLQSSYLTGRRVFRTELHGRNVTATVDADA
jgi:predicted dehydrogenase